MATTVEVSEDTWRRLNQRRRKPAESFDDVIQRLLEGDVETPGASS